MAKKFVAQEKSELDEFGREVPDPVPMAPPIGYKREPTMVERMRQMIRSEHLRIAAERAGAETFDEADDFEVGDDFDPTSPYEEVFDPLDYEARSRLRQQEYAASVDTRLQQLQPVKEKDSGTSSVDQGRNSDASGGSGYSDKKPKGKSSSKQDAADDRGLRDADRGFGEVEE